MAEKYCCFSGTGRVLLAEYDAYKKGLVGLKDIGNVTQADINITKRTLGENIRNRQTPSGGFDCVKELIDRASITFNFACFNEDTVKIALGATSSIVTAGSQAEQAIAYKGTWIPLKKALDKNSTITVTNIAGSTTYVEGTDYIFNGDLKSAIFIPNTSTIPNPTVTSGIGAVNVKINYTSLSTSVIGIANKATLPFIIQILGENEQADSDPARAFLSVFYKVNLSPANVVSLIGNGTDNTALSVTGEMLKDETIALNGGDLLSQYGQFIRAA